MKQWKKLVLPILSALGLFILILDAKTAIGGAREGIEICIRTLIPSLFPFFIVSGVFCSVYSGIRLPLLKPFIRLCRLPTGSEPLLITGFLGGYPVGAKGIAEAYKNGQLDQADARRMLGFCSNAGPAFIFGITSHQFSDPAIPWLLFLIIILSAIITGWFLPGERKGQATEIPYKNTSFLQIFQNSIGAMATVCGWVILFRVILTFLDHWFLWILPTDLQIIISGILELSNGCITLTRISNEGLRFMVASGMLAFGGLCVSLQTLSIAKELGMGLYFPGKVLQSLVSIILAYIVQSVIFETNTTASFAPGLIVLMVFLGLIAIIKFKHRKITVAFCGKKMYNADNNC